MAQDTNSNKIDTNQLKPYCFSGKEIKRIAVTTLKFEALKIHSKKQDTLIKSILLSHDTITEKFNTLTWKYNKLDKKYSIFKNKTILGFTITAAIVIPAVYFALKP